MNNALIVIDIQESFRQPLWQSMSNPHLFDNVNALVDAARRDGDMVVWVLHAEENSGGLFDQVNGFVRVVDERKPLDGEPTLVKTAHNSFTTTNLGQRLAQQGVREIRITGIRTEQCCETTVVLNPTSASTQRSSPTPRPPSQRRTGPGRRTHPLTTCRPTLERWVPRRSFDARSSPLVDASRKSPRPLSSSARQPLG